VLRRIVIVFSRHITADVRVLQLHGFHNETFAAGIAGLAVRSLARAAADRAQAVRLAISISKFAASAPWALLPPSWVT